jgi:hypothetical protein
VGQVQDFALHGGHAEGGEATDDGDQQGEQGEADGQALADGEGFEHVGDPGRVEGPDVSSGIALGRRAVRSCDPLRIRMTA